MRLSNSIKAPKSENDYQLQHGNMRRLRSFALVASVFLPLAELTATPSGAADAQVEIAIRDGQFAPSEVPVPAGSKVELVIRNEQSKPAEFESSSLHREKVVSPGATISVTVGPLKAGRYEFIDDFNKSAQGALAVK